MNEVGVRADSQIRSRTVSFDVLNCALETRCVGTLLPQRFNERGPGSPAIK